MVAKLQAEYNVEVDWRPYYLRPDTPPEGLELSEHIKRARANGSEERLSQMAQMHGMKFKSTERIYNTRLAHEATEFAREQGRLLEFHHAVFQKVYAEGMDISRWDVLRTAAQAAGLDGEAMQSEVESGKFTELVQAQVDQAQQIGVTGVPTYVMNNRYAVVGAQPYEVFLQVIDRLKADAAQRTE